MSRHAFWFEAPLPAGYELPEAVSVVDDPVDAVALVVGARTPWDDARFSALPRLCVIARSGIGYDNVDVAAATRHGVAAVNAPDAPTVSTAEHALALLLAVAKQLPASAARARTGATGPAPDHRALELDGLTLGLVGAGRIGSRVAGYAAALGMQVLVTDPALDQVPVGELVTPDELWRRADVVSLHAPLTPATRHLVDADTLAAMKPGVILVNCARGGLVDHDALLVALETGHVAGAGLDVTEPEPLPAGHPLLGRDDVIVTPHVASSTTVGRRRLVAHAVEQALVWLEGGVPEHLLDPAVVDRARPRPTSAGLPASGRDASETHPSPTEVP